MTGPTGPAGPSGPGVNGPAGPHPVDAPGSTPDKLIILGLGEEVLATHAPALPDRFYPYEFYVVCLRTDYDAQIYVECKPVGYDEAVPVTPAPGVPLGMLAAEPRIIGAPIDGAVGEYTVKITGAKGPWALEVRGTCWAGEPEETKT